MSAAFIEVEHEDGFVSLVNIANISRVKPFGSGVRIYFNAVSGFEGNSAIEESHFEWINSTNNYGEVVALIKKAGASVVFAEQEP